MKNRTISSLLATFQNSATAFVSKWSTEKIALNNARKDDRNSPGAEHFAQPQIQSLMSRTTLNNTPKRQRNSPGSIPFLRRRRRS